VLDQLPKLEVCLPHGGGALPYLAGRLEHGQQVRPEARDGARRKVTAYLRRFTYDRSHRRARRASSRPWGPTG
jgi:aminocarboxymuconate-semialdehyde decarboxylase